MSRTNIIIRLIDIVLLLLFGFLVISEIEKNSLINLPQSNVKVKKEIAEEELLIIGIGGENYYIIEGEDLELNSLGAVINKINSRKKTLEKKFDRKLRVRLRSEWNLPIKYTMRIANYCRKENIPVGMDVHSVSNE